MPTESSSKQILSPEILSLFDAIRGVGFPLVGAVDLDLARAEFRSHSERYKKWIENGHHGEMAYLERGLARRLDPTLVFSETKSVVACAIPYRRNPTVSREEDSPHYARYLEGPDYHHELPSRLKSALEAWNPEAKWKICVDTSAVLERSWAALAGLGWIGKNTLLIHPQLGSYFFIATILLDRKTGLAPNLLPSYCGNCTACLEACPTSAFTAPGDLDSRKCISYLTLEKRGDWTDVSDAIKEKIGNWVAGCDICQEVCPYNRKPLRLPETWPEHSRDSALITDLEHLSNEDLATYQSRVRDSALSRVKFLEMRRNIKNLQRNASPNSSP